MSSTSQKHRNFVAEPMGEKPVTDLAGIGEVLGKRMSEKGFDKVHFTFTFLFLSCKLAKIILKRGVHATRINMFSP